MSCRSDSRLYGTTFVVTLKKTFVKLVIEFTLFSLVANSKNSLIVRVGCTPLWQAVLGIILKLRKC